MGTQTGLCMICWQSYLVARLQRREDTDKTLLDLLAGLSRGSAALYVFCGLLGTAVPRALNQLSARFAGWVLSWLGCSLCSRELLEAAVPWRLKQDSAWFAGRSTGGTQAGRCSICWRCYRVARPQYREGFREHTVL